jgi:hypothetical protein
MTHIKNIPHILQYGITHRKSLNANPDYVAIGDISVIGTRETKQVNISNGNYSQSFGKITLGDCIPFYFDKRMPMLYVIQHGGNCVERATPKEDIIYVVCKISDIVKSGAIYYFSDGHALGAMTVFYDSSQINNLPNLLDWTAIKSNYWGGDENHLLRQKKEAEFLVANDIAPENICGFVCYNETVKQRLIEMGVNKTISVQPEAYY